MISSTMNPNGQNSSNLDRRNLLSNPMALVWQVVFMIAIGFADELTKFVPILLTAIKERYLTDFFQKQITEKLDRSCQLISSSAVALNTRHHLNQVSMRRMYNPDAKNVDRREEMNMMIDAVLDTVAKQHNVPSFRLIESAQVMISYKEHPIQLTKDIYLRLDSVTSSAEGNVETIDITLASNTVSAAEISRYVKHLCELRKEELKNALGDSVFYFDQKSKDSDRIPPSLGVSKNPAQDIENMKRMQIQTAPKQLSFSKTPFVSNKQFHNIFGEEARLIEKRVKFFLENREWYDTRGVPYQLGLMLSGPPGTGKTSCVRAIANLTRRHIINVNFSNIRSATQLKNLFFSEKLSVYTDSSLNESQTFVIPIDQRIYVLEEIDAVGDVLKQRTGTSQASALPDEVTLGEILTTFDGTVESPGRIIIMTSNHPELLDAALTRPGRVDVSVVFRNACLQQIADMFSAFYETTHTLSNLPLELDRQLTSAETAQVLLKHFDDPDPIIVQQDLLDTFANKKEIQERKETSLRDECNGCVHDAEIVLSELDSDVVKDMPGPDQQLPTSKVDPKSGSLLDQSHAHYDHNFECPDYEHNPNSSSTAVTALDKRQEFFSKQIQEGKGPFCNLEGNTDSQGVFPQPFDPSAASCDSMNALFALPSDSCPSYIPVSAQ